MEPRANDMDPKDPACDAPEAPRRACGGWRCLFAVSFVLVCVATGLTILWFGPSVVLRGFLNLLPRQPGWDWFTGLGLCTMVSIVTLMPIWPPLCMAAGLIFGVGWGTLLNFFALVGAAHVSIALGRTFLREPVREWLSSGKFATVQRMMHVLEDNEDSLRFQVLFRFLFIPMFVRNYGPSTLDIPLWKLSVSTLPHSLWAAFLFASLGASFSDVAELVRKGDAIDHRAFKWQQVLILVVSITIALLLAIYAHNKYQERLREEGEEEDRSVQPGCRCAAAVAFFVLFVALGLTVAIMGPSAVLRGFLELLPRDPGWGWFLGLCLATTLAIVTLMPVWPPLCMAAGLIFGVAWGTLLNFASLVGAAHLSLLLGRSFLREPVKDWLESGEERGTLRRTVRVLEDGEDSLKLQVLFRFLFIPLFVRNYGPATLEIPFWKLSVSTLPHSLWAGFLFASLGASFSDLAELVRNGDEVDHKAFKWQQVLILVVSFIIAVLLAVYAHNKYQERLAREGESDPLAHNDAAARA